MDTVTKIATTLEGYSYKPLLQSGDLNVTGGVQRGLCSIGIVPEGQAGRVDHRGPEVPGPWAFTTTHAVVIDNHGGSGAEAKRAQQVAQGEPVEIEGLPGVWTFADRDQRELEGEGVKLVPVDDAAKANVARVKAENELGWLAQAVGAAGVTSVRWRADRAAAAILNVATYGGDADALDGRLGMLLEQATANGKVVMG